MINHHHETPVQYLERATGPRLAYCRTLPVGAGKGDMPSVMYLGGFRSDMQGTKALYLEQQCIARNQGFIRFDYSGHGQSAGRFEDGTIESWRDDALSVLDRLVPGKTILVGSSMGGWIGLLLALARKDRVCGFVGIAAAPDFTRDMPLRFDDAMRASLESRGFAEVPSEYSEEPYVITRDLIESGNRVCLLDGQHALPIPVRLIQGLRDSDVPADRPQKIARCLVGANVGIDIVRDGDHRLSQPEDLALIDRRVMDLTDSYLRL